MGDLLKFPPVGEGYPLRQQLIRSLAEDGAKPRLVSETAADWLIRVGPQAKRLNEQSRHDPKDAA